MKTLFSLILAFAGLTTFSALADERRLLPVKPSAEWKQECGACHLAFPPRLLPAESWRKMMGSLDQHFGTDASLSPRENREITDFLVKNAASRWRSPTAPSRITETAHFLHEHDEIAAAVWKRAVIKSPSNCAACHPAADHGDFNEHRVRIPR
ncbi:MAG: diheme cytochrome c [Gallionellaceae bacterium]|nr:diheme cytochrome c [Gallionellaceae bacterium]